MKELIPAAALALAIVTPLAAQEVDGKQRARELLAGLTAVDEALLGTTWLGLHLPGGKNIGRVCLKVERAPELSGAAYRVETKVDMAFGATKVERRGTYLLAADLGVVSHSADETLQEGETTTRERTEVDRKDGAWVCSITENERSAEFTHPASGSVHQGLGSLVLLARKLDVAQPGRYVFAEVDWPELPEEGAEAAKPVRKDVVVEVPVAAAYDHRGAKLQAYTLSFGRSEETLEVVVDAQRKLLSFGPKDSPVRMIVAKDEAEAGADLGGAVKIEPGPKTPRGACALYLLIIAKARPATDLDEVMDWGAILKWFQSNNLVRWREYDAGRLRDELVDEFKTVEAGVTKEQAEQFIGMLTVDLRGERATVKGPGMPPFELVKQEDGLWKIVRFPS